MRRGLVRATVVVVAALLLATPTALTSPAQAAPRVARDPAVITTHFRKAVVEGNRLGHRVSRWALQHYFQPVDDD
jgi:hypothetical protein